MLKALLLLWTIESPQSDTLLLVNSNEVLDSAYELRADDKYDESIQLLELVNEEDSNYYEVQTQLLSTLNAAQQYNRTISLARRLLEAPNDIMAQIMLSYGNAYLNSGNIDSAKYVYKQGLEEFPYNHIIYYNLGVAHFRDSEYEASKKCFQKCLKINPFYSSSHLMLGHISILEGLRAKGLMSYLTYLMINPQNNSALITIENLVTDGLRYEGTVASKDEIFTYYDNLIKSKAALDERFNYRVDFNVATVKQSELFFSKLKPMEGDDFWVKFYLPLFIQLRNNDLVDVTLYKILKSTNNEEVLKWLEKNGTLSERWVEVVNRQLGLWRDKDYTTVLGDSALYDYWYYDNNDFNAVGNENEAGNKVGPWVFYHDNSQLSAVGRFNASSEKIGEWKYYHENGVMSRIEVYDEAGNITQPAIYYKSDGSKATEVPYEGKTVAGVVNYYYPCDQVRETVTYQDDKASGPGAVYYKSGAKKIEYTMADGELSGDYTMYHQTGNVSHTYNFEEGNKHGLYQLVYNNGVIEESGTYKNDLTDSLCVGYFSSGNKSYEGMFAEGEKVGNWKYYYDNGRLRFDENYDDSGALHGELIAYHLDGFVESKNVYDHDKLVGYEYYDEQGNVLFSADDPDGNMPFERWRWTGSIYSKGQLKEGQLDGAYTIYHDNGAVYQKGSMKEGNWHGVFTEYYRSGVVSFTGAYEEGLEQGYFVYYNRQGQKIYEGHYINGAQEQNWKRYFQNGQVEEDAYMRAGEYQGWTSTYTPDAKIWSRMKYNEGKVIEYMLYDTAGQIFMHKKLPFATGKFDYLFPNGEINFYGQVACGEYKDAYKHYFPDGKLLSDRPMVNGVFHGLYKKYNHRGGVLIEGSYENNSRTGAWKYYTEDGILERVYQYEDDQLHGKYIRYYENGQAESEISYYRGERHGPSNYYDTKGNLQVIKHYDVDEGLVAYQYSGKNGELTDKVKFTSNTEKLEAFFPNGKRSVLQEYKEGLLHGVTTYYSIDGKVLEEGTFEEGDYQGDHLQYFPNGKIKNKTTYLNDEAVGKAYHYYENGQVKRVTEFRFDDQNGWERIYDKNGKELEAWFYWNDYIYE